VSEDRKKKQGDYRSMIRARAEITQRLRQKKFEKMDIEKMDRGGKRATHGLRQKLAEAKRKEE